MARLRLTWSFALGNITARRFASRRGGEVAATVGGTANACSTKKKSEREKRRAKLPCSCIKLHYDVRTRLRGGFSLFLSLSLSLSLRSQHTATKILPVLAGMR